MSQPVTIVRVPYSDVTVFTRDFPGEISVAITLRKVACGTEFEIVRAGIPNAIPAEYRYAGWQESLALLACLVEPEIPGKP